MKNRFSKQMDTLLSRKVSQFKKENKYLEKKQQKNRQQHDIEKRNFVNEAV